MNQPILTHQPIAAPQRGRDFDGDRDVWMRMPRAAEDALLRRLAAPSLRLPEVGPYPGGQVGRRPDVHQHAVVVNCIASTLRERTQVLSPPPAPSFPRNPPWFTVC